MTSSSIALVVDGVVGNAYDSLVAVLSGDIVFFGVAVALLGGGIAFVLRRLHWI